MRRGKAQAPADPFKPSIVAGQAVEQTSIQEVKTTVSIDVAKAAAALLYGGLDTHARPFLAAAGRRCGTKAFRKAGIKPEGGTPVKPAANADNFNMRSLIDWVNSVEADDGAAVGQLRGLIATARARGG